MTSKRLKEHKEIHDEIFSKKDFLDVSNCLVNREWHEKMGKRSENTQEKHVLKVEMEKLRLENIDLKK